MPHVHSLYKRQCRYYRAVSRGYIRRSYCAGDRFIDVSIAAEADLTKHASLFPSDMQVRDRLRIVRMQCLLQLTIASIMGRSIDGLGRAYQTLRGCVPPAIAQGVKLANLLANRFRHNPLQYPGKPLPDHFYLQTAHALQVSRGAAITIQRRFRHWLRKIRHADAQQMAEQTSHMGLALMRTGGE